MEEYANKLPIELINKIINYTDVVAFRNGKYINRIPKTDARYAMLKNLVKPVKLGKRVLINLINYSYEEPTGYFIEYVFDKYPKVNIYYTTINKCNEYINHSEFKLMRDSNGICREFVKYKYINKFNLIN
jgi:hypothetical protein